MMQRLTRWAAKLYPQWWRERYGDEFEALLEDARPGFGGAVDVAKGALAMRFSTVTLSKTLLAGAGVGLIIGYATTWLVTPQFSSSSMIAISAGDNFANHINSLSQQVLGRTQLVDLIRNLDLYASERQRMPIEDVLNTMRRSIRISAKNVAGQSKSVPAMELSFTYPDRLGAQKVVSALTGAYIDANVRVRDSEPVRLELKERASFPRAPVLPNRLAISLGGLGAGFLIAGMYAWRRSRRRPTAQPPAA